jgi:hypothetical protein
MANKRRKNRLMKKYFWRLGCVEARIRSDARRADVPPALRAGSINDVAECGCASLIGPWNKHFFRAIHEPAWPPPLPLWGGHRIKTINRITRYEARELKLPRDLSRVSAELFFARRSLASLELWRRAAETDLWVVSLPSTHPQNVDGETLLARRFGWHSAHQAGYDPRWRFSWVTPSIATAILNEGRMRGSVPDDHRLYADLRLKFVKFPAIMWNLSFCCRNARLWQHCLLFEAVKFPEPTLGRWDDRVSSRSDALSFHRLLDAHQFRSSAPTGVWTAVQIRTSLDTRIGKQLDLGIINDFWELIRLLIEFVD